MNLAESMYKVSCLYPDKIGVICGEDRFTYREFASRIYKLAEAFRNQGLTKGDRVAIIHQNCHYFLEAYYATAFLGIILCPINYRLSARELAFILKDTGAKVIIAQPQFSQLVQDGLDKTEASIDVFWTSKGVIPKDGTSIEDLMRPLKGNVIDANANGDDIAQLYYTSGTTGRQKGVMLTHKNVAYHALGTIAELKMSDEDIWIHVAPMFHLADAWATWATTWVGGTHVMVPEFEPKVVMALMERERVTLTNMIPTMLNLMVNDSDIVKYDFSSLRVMLSGGAPIAPEIVKKIMDAFGCDYVQTYGMTETSPYLTMSILKDYLKCHPENEQFKYKAATGRPVIFVQLKVLKDDGSEVNWDDKEVGEIVVKGDSVTPGYWNLPEETEKSIKDGWLHTGDLAVVDSEGYVNIVDRKKDMIVTGGENVYSTEVENVLYEHPAILEAAVIGVPDEKWGEAVHAGIVLKEGMSVSEKEIIEFCKQNLARYKAPKSVSFLPSLPKTGSGKIFKKALRDEYVS
jgi:fatty-acyl-CoA synthase